MEYYKSASVHLNLALKYLEEGKTLSDKDPIQASEKLYKAAEEALKAMALVLGLDEARKAVEQGRWSSTLLFDTIDSIAIKLGVNELPLWWRAAWFLHVEGFHEAKLSVERIKKDSKYVNAIVDLAKKVLQGKNM
jgi:Archaeal PaREP1/PaREP8 family.